MNVPHIRNIAIIAHVDHGKTTLVDGLLRQTGTFRENEEVVDRVMDSLSLERERGITILAKHTSVRHKGMKINIVDTPGHADFGAEVERTLNLVDGVLLLVDAAEGPMPQTRFVLRKALAKHLPAIIVLNKIDRQDARPEEVLDLVFDLFIDLGCDESALESPVIYCNARAGVASTNLSEPGTNLQPLLDLVVDKLPPPPVGGEGGLQMLVSSLDYNSYVGRLAIGRIFRGAIRQSEPVAICRADRVDSPRKVTVVYTFEGLRRKEAELAEAGEIVAVAGLEDIAIGDTIADPEAPAALTRIAVEEPTIAIYVYVNDSPFAGKEGTYVTSRQIRERLVREAYGNVSIRIQDTDSPDTFKVLGRGELQLGILLETMRREGYEVAVGKPEVVVRNENGRVLEPMELVVVDLPEEYLGTITQALANRKGRMKHLERRGDRVLAEFRIPARGLIGFRSSFLTLTRGTGLMSAVFDTYGDWQGDIPSRTTGALVSDRLGKSVAYALNDLQERGSLFIGPGVDVYEGMICGECARERDLNVNVTRTKKLTNIRAAGRDENVSLTPPRRLTLDQCLEFIADDELCEITPSSLRLRKKVLRKAFRD